MPINTEAENRYMIFDNVGQTHYFALEFERMPEGKAFNILEDESNPNAYNFYSVLVFPLLGWLRDLHPLYNAHAERTTKKSLPDATIREALLSYDNVMNVSGIILDALRFRGGYHRQRCAWS